MDIASKYPFSLQVIKQYPVRSVLEAGAFTTSLDRMWKENIVAISIEENDDINIIFNSDDANARLYLEALDIVPSYDCEIDDAEGLMYRKPSSKEFVLVKQGNDYDSLKVDSFVIKVFCLNKWFYGIFKVNPKQMSIPEWNMMRDDLEKEVVGLAQDLIRRNIGIGDVSSGKIPPKLLYEFFVIKKYSQKLMFALSDIAENPRYDIRTEYRMVPLTKNKMAFDSETVKRYIVRSGSEISLKIPQKIICYDVHENRLLKKIVSFYEKELTRFIEALDNFTEIESCAYNSSSNNLNDVISSFRITALKLRNMTSILKAKNWYADIADVVRIEITHAFILDSRYNLFYQLQDNLKKKTIQVEFDPSFSYTWKQSSKLYEMWCFLKVCHILGKRYSFMGSTTTMFLSEKILFPLLEEGKKIQFEDSNLRLDVIYNCVMPTTVHNTTVKNPLALVRFNGGVPTHNKPDIVINVFDKNHSVYIGSLIMECKYRKLRSFWSDNGRSSREQLATYYNNARSTYLFGERGEILNMRPVDCVLVLTPDLYGESVAKEDFKILIKSFKPTDTGILEESVENELVSRIEEMKMKVRSLYIG